MPDLLTIEKAALACVAFFRENHLNTNKLSFVGEHLDETCMWDLDKVLIVAPTNVDLLLPFWVFADDQRSKALLYQEIDDSFAGCMQVVINTPRTPIGKLIKFVGIGTLLPAQNRLKSSSLLIVPLVDTLDRSAVNVSWDKTTFV